MGVEHIKEEGRGMECMSVAEAVAWLEETVFAREREAEGRAVAATVGGEAWTAWRVLREYVEDCETRRSSGARELGAVALACERKRAVEDGLSAYGCLVDVVGAAFDAGVRAARA